MIVSSVDVGELGPLPGPLLTFGGPYGNRHALAALRAEAERRGIASAAIVCTGDLVAYAGEPEATVDAIREWGIHVIRGNVDEALGAAAGDCGCGFTDDSVCNAMAEQWYAHCLAHTSADNRPGWRGCRRG
jgi:hypothetical protein